MSQPNFPNSPQPGDTYTYSGSVWTWTGAYWRVLQGVAATGGSIVPASNVAYDLGSDSLRWRDLYLSGNSLIIGGATLTATGSALTLPAGSTLGGQNLATSGDVSTGGGPKITNLQVTSNVYAVLDDTAVDITGGFIRLTGTNFVTGCMVYVASTPANSTTFVSTTEVRAQLPAIAAGTYPVYLVNPDGGTAIRVPGVTFSASPAWQTASSLGEQYDGIVLTLPVVATDATVYTLTSGSLPPGLSLNSNTGVISGTVSGVANDTVYSFTITATDAQLQDSPRTFTVTITVSDPYFKLTTLLLSGSALSANTVVRDSSTNNFNLTVFGDARASNFTPYGTGWSVYFDGTGDYLELADNDAWWFGSGDFTVEAWIYHTSGNPGVGGTQQIVGQNFGTESQRSWTFSTNGNSSSVTGLYGEVCVGSTLYSASATGLTISLNTWHHVAFVRTTSTLRLFLNGQQVATGAVSGSANNAAQVLALGRNGFSGYEYYFYGYISNLRIVKNTAVYTANFTPATTNLTAVANTSLLTCHVNGFRDASANNFTITRNGDARVVSFNPFNITNTGVAGSMYFDGTGDYVTAPSNAAFGPSGDFTFESWLYWTGGSNENTLFCVDVTGGINIGLAFGTGGANWGIGRRAQVVDNEFGTAPIKFTWNHLAVSRQSGTIRAFVNGRLVFSGANTVSYVAGPPGIACIATASTNILQGYISDARFVSAAVYTANFTPATSSLTAIANTQLLTLQYDQPHNNHTFLDSSSNQFLITRNGNATQGTFSPFSPAGWSMFVGGAGYQRWDTNTNYSGTDLTIECWAYAIATTSTFTSLVSSNLGTGNYYQYFNLAIDGSNRLICDFYGTGNVTCNNAASFPLNTWVHCAVVLTSAGAVSLYQDGVRVATTTAASIASIATGIQIGGIVQTSGGAYTAYFNGYISNARIVKSAVYSGTTITVPIAPLSVIANTNLLVCSENRAVDKANGYALGVNTISRTAVAFSPFAPTAVYNPTVHGGSAYFDGTGDCLTVPDNELLDLGTSNFTIELWIYLTASVATAMVLAKTPNSSTYGSYEIRLSSTTVVMFLGSTGSSWDIASAVGTGTTSLNSWTHIALVRSASTFTLYVNGNASGTATSSSSLFNNTSALGIAANPDASYPYTGYISNFRVIKGTALYTSNFTPPTAPLTTINNTSLLLNFTDAAILDSTGRTVIETVADAKSSSVITKFTGGSMSFDGTGDYIIMPDVLTGQFGTGDFTVEYWDRHGSQGTNYAPQVGTLSSGTGSGSWRFGTFSNLAGVYLAYHNGTSFIDVVFGSTVYNDNIWRHFALSRQGTTVRAFVDGVQVGSNQTVSQNFNSSNRVILGAELTSPTYFTGYLADLRITKGYARYTANFTAPTAPARLK